MARPKKPSDPVEIKGETDNPETATQNNMGSEIEAVKDIPPSNKFGEPLESEYPLGTGAEITQATLKPSETIVEHPLSPTDTNPNPHGNRDEPFVAVAYKDADGKVQTTAPGEGDVEITGVADEVHLGDGRVLRKDGQAKVSKEVAKQLRESGQAK